MSSKENFIELEGIKFKCFSLIEFSSLTELLKLLAKKYKTFDDKISNLDERMIEKDKRISELEIMLKGVSQSTEDKLRSLVDEQKEKEKIKEKNMEKKDKNLDNKKEDDISLNNISENENSKKEKENEAEKKSENDEEDINLYEKENENENEEKDSNININKKNENEEKDSDINKKNENHSEEITDENKYKDLGEENPIIFDQNNIQTTTTNINLNRGVNSGANINTNDLNKVKGESNKELFSKILKTLKAHETKINDLLARNNEFLVINKNIKVHKNEMEELEKKIKNLKNNITDINRKLLGYNDDLEKIKVKVTDFDVYDLFKGGEGDVDLDAAKILIKTLENKVFKKFEIYDDKNKQIDKDVFKIKEDVKNALAIVDGMKNKTDRNSQNLDELSQNFDNKISNFENIINDIQRQIETINNKINSKPDFSNIKKDFEKKLKDLEEKLNSKLDLFLNKDPTDTNNNEESSQISKNEILSIIKDLRKRIGELEKFTSTNFEKINADDLKKRLGKLEVEVPKKSGKYEMQELTEKIRSLDEFLKDLNFKQDSLQQFTEKVRMDLAQIIKKIEFLSGEYSKLAFNKNTSDSDDGLNNVDLSKFLDLNTFNDNRRDVNNKFEKVRLGFEDLSREIEEILSKLSHTPTDKDFSEFQNIIKSLIDDLKISSSKKFADKIETSKSIKFLETQIKTLHDAFLKKNEAGDNWLLAKKPINNYVCASCEANIRGELDKRTEFVPWNRYPQRDEKAYRIGHGFSRMLQMVNEDIIKNAGEKGYSSDEDKKLNFKNSNTNNNLSTEKNIPVNTSVKLPKVTRKKPLLGGIAVTEPNNYNTSTLSPYDDADGENNNINKPQIMRVIRKNKGNLPQNELSNRENDNLNNVNNNNDNEN